MDTNTGNGNTESMMPDRFDRKYALLHDLPDVVKTKKSIVTHVAPLGVGGIETFLVQTIRQREVGDTIFLEVTGAHGHVRIVLPPKVADAIGRQRDALTTKSRSNQGKAVAAGLKERGIEPGFMRAKKGGRK